MITFLWYQTRQCEKKRERRKKEKKEVMSNANILALHLHPEACGKLWPSISFFPPSFPLVPGLQTQRQHGRMGWVCIFYLSSQNVQDTETHRFSAYRLVTSLRHRPDTSPLVHPREQGKEEETNGRPPPSVEIEMCLLSRLSAERMPSEMVREPKPGCFYSAEDGTTDTDAFCTGHL
ncbi:hypothetical protein INR49_022970 [Caranx melampygus]|nr:hypothetical protein INR49_022970 [Caranx melampygus]